MVNYQGGWIRGDASDYEAWAKLVDDPKWSYSGLLPYFRKVERYHSTEINTHEHGYEGVIHTQSVSSTSRNYPLREPLRAAWESIGVTRTTDANSGKPKGLGELVENLCQGARQLASTVYSLAGVEVMTETLVKRVVVDFDGYHHRASGIELANGQTYAATQEVILSAGAYRSPQLLLLSGIGPAKELAAHGITAILDVPHVGKNLHDHMAVAQWWKLKHPEKGLALGSPQFNDPAFFIGTPLDWITTTGVPQEGLAQAVNIDNKSSAPANGVSDDSFLNPARSRVETLIVYAAMNEKLPEVPMDGTHITSTVMGMLPTSRGSITLSSTNPADQPVIDPNYNATEADRYVMRSALRTTARLLLGTEAGQSIVAHETVADGQPRVSSKSTDAEIDKVIRARGKSVVIPISDNAVRDTHFDV